MKKILLLILVILLPFSLSAKGGFSSHSSSRSFSSSRSSSSSHSFSSSRSSSSSHSSGFFSSSRSSSSPSRSSSSYSSSPRTSSTSRTSSFFSFRSSKPVATHTTGTSYTSTRVNRPTTTYSRPTTVRTTIHTTGSSYRTVSPSRTIVRNTTYSSRPRVAYHNTHVRRIYVHHSFIRNDYYYRNSPSYWFNGTSFVPYFHYNLIYGYWYFIFFNHDTMQNEMIKADTRAELQAIVYSMRDAW